MGLEPTTFYQALESPDNVYGRCNTVPNATGDSANRLLMSASQQFQKMTLAKPEVPLIQTGRDTYWGEFSSSYLTAPNNLQVIAKIPKYSHPKLANLNYYLITRNLVTGEYDYYHKEVAKHTTQSYGFRYDTSKIDSYTPGQIIPQDSVITRSVAWDDFGNKADGINALTWYNCNTTTTEDSCRISESFSWKMAAYEVIKEDILINSNELLCNMYGDKTMFKTFPDIGEEIKGGIFCSSRRADRATALATQSSVMLKSHMISDRDITIKGVVADIDVYCNDLNMLNRDDNAQLRFYHDQYMEFCNTFHRVIEPIKAAGGKCSRELDELWHACKETVDGVPFVKDRQFNGVMIRVLIYELRPLICGDKIADRHGGKGVVSEVVPDELMPRLATGEIIDIEKNFLTMVGRENPSQIHEMSLNYISNSIIHHIIDNRLSDESAFEILSWYIGKVSPNYYEWMMSLCSHPSEDDNEFNIHAFVSSILEQGDIVLSIPPYGGISRDTIVEVYEHFPWLNTHTEIYVYTPTSSGQPRYLPAARPVVAGKVYNLRMKQYGEEKSSSTGLPATNSVNLPSKTKQAKIHEAPYSRTPIKIGDMECGNLCHVGANYVVMHLLLHSTAPNGRKLFEQLLTTSHPYDIDISVSRNPLIKSRPAETVVDLLKAVGLKLEFWKEPIEYKNVAAITPNFVPPWEWEPTEMTKALELDDAFFKELDLEIARDKSIPYIKVADIIPAGLIEEEDDEGI